MVIALCCCFSEQLVLLVRWYKYLIYVSEASICAVPSCIFYLMECFVNKGENEGHKFILQGELTFLAEIMLLKCC